MLSRRVRSLPSRIVISVFTAALVTGVAVTWVSTRSIESFLRAGIDQRFPGILLRADERLQLWYRQRELDVATFASSETVVEGLARLDRDPRAPAELSVYLEYVLDSSPQYETLLLVNREGRIVLAAGEPVDLPGAVRRRLVRRPEPRVEPLQRLEEERVQLVSAPVRDAEGRAVASLLALLRLSSVEAALSDEDLGPSGGIYVVSRGGEVLLRSPGSPVLERSARPLPEPGLSPTVTNYRHANGNHVVGSSLAVDRFGWTLLVEQSYDEAFAPVVGVIRQIVGINASIVLVFGIIAYLMARSIVRPIHALSDGALRIATGETDVMIEGHGAGDEIGVLTRAFNEMSSRLRENQSALEESRIEVEEANARLIAQNRELQRMNEVFQQLSITDDLTKLHNHRFFQEHLPSEIKRSRRTGEPLSLILMDIDDFKKLNDRFGHSVGDAVLRRVAEVMSRNIREMDLLARYGGEEFVLLASQTDLRGAAGLAEKIRLALVGARFSVVDPEGPLEMSVTASFGVAEFRGDEKAFFNAADRALYEAKASGKDCVVRAEPGEDRSGT